MPPRGRRAVLCKDGVSRDAYNSEMDDRLVQHFTLLGWTFQSLMVVMLALILATMLVARIEDGWCPGPRNR
jgi:hypothetical protein